MKALAFELFAKNAHTTFISVKTALFMMKAPITNAGNPQPTESQTKKEIMCANTLNP